MNKLVPPCCLLLAMTLFVVGFALLAVDSPDPSVELHRARAGTDEPYRELLERQLLRRQRFRKGLVVGSFALGVTFTAVAFVTMQSRPA
ncbi:MAG: hypothetical protein A2W31_13140 [Planctomycetes bacterium RBG_16_64_10]|nr:MAG: hypothetical protein A2W31_13140 [Planctomycetes bacterium RBG_16_64_10]